MYQLIFAIITTPFMTGDFANRITIVRWIKVLIIHITAGFGCVAGIRVLGNRAVKNDKEPFNLGLVSVGAGILLFGWFVFNAGSSLAAADTSTIVFTNTGVAGVFGMITWSIFHYIEHKRFSFLEMILGQSLVL
ncbi:ammonium transporter [Romboutsia ilealis]|uniref:Ammonium transporter n=1 Tax=Romboutsia ilealis TaxID=1115758 RepID=A0A1V1I1A2_9FIRM|nr:ammonium transporter [Romboutsia ilealis]CED93998.1 Ammonium transporter AmtB-like domain [Romboutsia ilealis]